MTHTYSKTLFHLIWSTKNRAPFIHSTIKTVLYSYINGIIENKNCKLIVMNGMPDHLHLLISLPLTVTPSEITQQIKVSSTRWLRKHHPELSGFSWQEGFACFTVGYSTLESTRNYIINQEKHHQKISFEAEYLSLLEKLKIPYDRRFVFG